MEQFISDLVADVKYVIIREFNELFLRFQDSLIHSFIGLVLVGAARGNANMKLE